MRALYQFQLNFIKKIGELDNLILKEISEKIEKLLNLNHWYIVSPYLKIYPYESDFDNLEDYFENHYLKDYCESIKKILFMNICYYDSIVYLTEFYEGNPFKKFEKYVYNNFRDRGLEEISTALELVIINGKTHMNVYIPCKNSLIAISSGFDTTIFSEDEEFLKDMDLYAKSEGLFFIKRD